MSGKGARDADLRDQIIDTATHLFAELGYDQTPLTMIADTTGIGLPVLQAEVGAKKDLYVAVMERAYLQERQMLNAAIAEFTPDRAGVHRFLDRYLDFYLKYPHISALWLQRRLQDAADITGIERAFSAPQLRMVAGTVAPALAPHLDPEFVLWTIVWTIDNFVQGGIPDAEGHRLGLTDPATTRRFRTHMHHLTDYLISHAPPPAPGPR